MTKDDIYVFLGYIKNEVAVLRELVPDAQWNSVYDLGVEIEHFQKKLEKEFKETP